MKLFKTAKPVQFNITQANKGNGQGFNSAFKLERTRFPKPTSQDILTRMIVKRNSNIPDLNVGDVLRGTRQEFHILFGDDVNDVNKHCQSATQVSQNTTAIEITVGYNDIFYTDTQSSSEEVVSTDVIYKGVPINLSITVNGVPFNSIEDAKRGIDLATQMLKVA